MMRCTEEGPDVLEECADAADLQKAGFEGLQCTPLQLISKPGEWPADKLLYAPRASPIRLPPKQSRALC